jgi:hypothetical protein
LATYSCRGFETLLTTEVQVLTATPPSTSVATLARPVDGRRRENKQRDSRMSLKQDIQLIGNRLTPFFNLYTHDSTSLSKVVLMTRV